MTSPEVQEQLEILRRIADRGLSRSLPFGYDAGDSGAVDIFQHLLDEIQHLKRMLQ